MPIKADQSLRFKYLQAVELYVPEVHNLKGLKTLIIIKKEN